MRKVFTDQTLTMVVHAQNVLEAANIPSVIRNEYASGGVGELSFIDAWPELWVVKDDDYDRACVVISENQSVADEADWLCDVCGEFNGAAFETCWQCSHSK